MTPTDADPALPAASVIIPSFNRARLLPEAIDSVLRQTYADFELVVVDDGSSDDTRAVVAAITDPRGRVIRLAHGGISRALNTGIRAARGRYIARLDSDDPWAPGMLATLLPVLERDASIGLAYGRAQAIAANGRLLPHTIGTPGRFPGETLRCVAFDDCTCNPALLARRECLVRAGLYDEQLSANEDWDMWLRIARRHEFVFVDAVVAYIRWHGDNLTGPGSREFAAVLAGRTRPLDKLFADPALPPDVVAMKSRAYANVHLFRGSRWLQAGYPGRGISNERVKGPTNAPFPISRGDHNRQFE